MICLSHLWKRSEDFDFTDPCIFGSQSPQIRIWQVKSQVICLFAYAKIVLIAFQALVPITTSRSHCCCPSFLCTHCPPALPFAFVIVPWRLISLFANTLPRLLLSICMCVYENKIYYVSTIKYTIQKKRPMSTRSKERATLAIGIKKLCRAHFVPSLVFALIALLAAGIHVAWALYWHLSWHLSWCWCWHLFSPIRVGIRRAGIRMGVHCAGVCTGVCLAVVRAFEQASVLLLCWHSHRCLSCCRAGVRVGVHHAGVCTGVCLAVVQAFEQVCVLLLCWHSHGHLSCCHAGVCAGIRHAAISTGIRRVCWCRVLVPRGWHSCHH